MISRSDTGTRRMRKAITPPKVTAALGPNTAGLQEGLGLVMPYDITLDYGSAPQFQGAQELDESYI